MSLDLDDRHRAMLQEMGVHVWWPQTPALELIEPTAPVAAPPPVSVAVAVAVPDLDARRSHTAVVVPRATSPQAPSRPAVMVVSDDTPGPAVRDEVASMDWAGLSQTIGSCRACKLCAGRRAPVFSALSQGTHADWMVVGDPPEDSDERAGHPFADQVGLLLDNMLKAVGVIRQNAAAPVPPAQAAYLTPIVKCRPALPTAPQPHDVAACEVYLKREIALIQPKVILALGPVAAQALLRENAPQSSSLPLGKLRGQVYRYQGIPVVVSYPPSYLLRKQQEKARAWADLCLALSVARPDQS